MPEGHDYRAFFDLLDHPEAWTDRDREQVEWVLVQQREVLASCQRPAGRRQARRQLKNSFSSDFVNPLASSW